MPFLFRLPNRFHVYLFFVCFLIGLSSNVLALDQFCDYLYYMASVCIIWHLQNPCIKTCSHTFALLFSFVNVSILAHFRLMLRVFSLLPILLKSVVVLAPCKITFPVLLKHFDQSYGFALGWEHDYFFNLTLRGVFV